MHAILVKFGLNWPKFGQKGDQNYICMDKILNEDEGKRKNIKKKRENSGNKSWHEQWQRKSHNSLLRVHNIYLSIKDTRVLSG